MKLIRLSPLSQRLRRVAKAHAAGETSLIDYRHARRQLLAEVVPLPVRKVDDTHRRGQMEAKGAAVKGSDNVSDITQRSADGLRSAQRVSKASVEAETTRQRVKRVQHRWMIGALALVVAALWALLRA